MRLPNPAASVLFLAAMCGPLAAGLPRVLRTIPLGGEGGWDYLAMDGQARRIYIARATRVMVVDADSGRLVGEVPGTEGVHGIALAPELGLGFTSNGRSSTVTCFELATLKVRRVIPIPGKGPDAILYDPFSRRVLTFNGGDSSVTALDAASGTVAGSLALPGTPESADTDGAGRIFVNLEDRNQVAVLGARDLKLRETWPLGSIEEPTGLAYDGAHRLVYATGRNAKVAVLDAGSGKLLAELPSDRGTDAAVFDPATGRVYAANGAGTLTVLEGPHVLGSVPTLRGARTLALDARTHHLFLVTADFGPAPAPTPARSHPRPPQLPGSFKLLEVGE